MKNVCEVVDVELMGDFKVRLSFDDGTQGELDLSDIIVFEGVFSELKDPVQFEKLALNRELGTIVWPNGADLDPVVLHSLVSGQPIEMATPRTA